MINSDLFISCDWGTSNFRLRLVEKSSLSILAEVNNHDGIKALYQKFKSQNQDSQKAFFSKYLKSQIQNLPNVRSLPKVVISGMASSSIGMIEIEYAEFPFHHNAEDLLVEKMKLPSGHSAVLVSGVKSKSGMIRGEEVQAIGLSDEIAEYNKGVLILPGTHSKHISFEEGRFTHLSNFMTGELFELLTKSSILSNSVEPGLWTKNTEDVFDKGLELGYKEGAMPNLLKVRAFDVIHDRPHSENFYFLSGLLIGNELSYLKNEKEKIILAAPESIFLFYKKGLEKFHQSDQLVFFSSEVLARALLNGQRKILGLHND